MKKINLLLLFVGLLTYTQAQVGINTINPQGIFHIDGQGDTNGAINLTDDIIISNNGNIGVGILPTDNAFIRFVGGNRGITLPRVNLTSSTDITTIPMQLNANVDRSMTVYHIGGGGMPAGMKVWNGSQWLTFLTDFQLPLVSMATMTSNINIERQAQVWSAYQVLPYSPNMVIQENGNYRISVRQELDFNNTNNIVSNSFGYNFQLLRTRSGVTTIADQYARYVLLSTSTGGYSFEITFDFYVNNLELNDILTLQVRTQFNHNAAAVNNINSARWTTNYNVTNSRVIYQKIN